MQFRNLITAAALVSLSHAQADEAKPADAAPLAPAPSAPEEPAPIAPAPIESAPVEPSPALSTPVESTPVAPSSDVAPSSSTMSSITAPGPEPSSLPPQTNTTTTPSGNGTITTETHITTEVITKTQECTQDGTVTICTPGETVTRTDIITKLIDCSSKPHPPKPTNGSGGHHVPPHSGASGSSFSIGAGFLMLLGGAAAFLF